MSRRRQHRQTQPPRSPCATCRGRLVFRNHPDARLTGAASAFHKQCGWPTAFTSDKTGDA